MPSFVLETHHAKDLLFNQYATELIKQLAVQQDSSRRTLLIHLNLKDSTTYHDIAATIARFKPDHVICFSGPEPHWLLERTRLLAALGDTPHSFIGYIHAPNSTFLDFWALCIDKFFPRYNDQQLVPVESDRFYLCHNRQPYQHRQMLVSKIDTNCGFVSLGNLTGPGQVIDTSLEFYPEESTHTWHVKKDGTFIEIPYDTYTLGDTTVWQQTVLNIVSDSFWINDPNKFGNVFLSEKYYKPILGLRPFVTYGNPDTYFKLKELGFKTFEEDLGISIQDLVTTAYTASDAIVKAVEFLKDLGPSSRISWYNSLESKLNYNRQRFHEHIAEQQALVDNYASKT